MSIKIVYFAHGSTEANEKELVDNIDYPLSTLGIEQATNQGNLVKNQDFDLVITSDFTRAVQTAEIMFGDRNILMIQDKRLREINVGIANKIDDELNLETPFGNIETDKDFLKSLHKKNKIDYFEDEFIHKDEHSIGFQLVFLQYLYHQKKNFSIVPILCSSFGEEDGNNNSLRQIFQFEEFVSSLKETIKESKKKSNGSSKSK